MNDDDKKAETKLVFVVLACIRFCSFVLSESCSGNRYESCSGEIKISYTALIDYAMRESLLNKLSIDTSYRAFLRLMWYIHRLLSFQAMIVLVLSSIGLRLLRWHCKLTMVRNGYYPEQRSGPLRSGPTGPGSGYSIMPFFFVSPLVGLDKGQFFISDQ